MRQLDDMDVRLQKWIRETGLPHASSVRVTATGSPAGAGASAGTRFFELSYWDDAGHHDDQIVARIEPLDDRLFPDTDLAFEAQLLTELRRHTSIPVPTLRWLVPAGEVHPGAVLITDRVHGEVPLDMPTYHKRGWLADAGPSVQESVWWQALDELVAVHAVDWAGTPLAALAGPTPPHGLDGQLAYYDEFLAWAARGEPQPVLEATRVWLDENRPEEGPAALCWGDARLGNMVFRDARPVLVLDWEMATIADPIQDLGWWLYFDRLFSEGLGSPRLPGLPGRDATIAWYADRTGRSVSAVDYYEVFAAFRFGVITIRFAQKMHRLGAIASARENELDNPTTRMLQRLLGL